MLANPMTYCDPTTPTSPSNYNLPSNITSNPNTPTNAQQGHGGFARSMERWSLKGKSNFFKRFNRTASSGGGNGGNHVQKEEEFGGDGSSGSEHDDPFSVSSMIHCMLLNFTCRKYA